LEVEVAITAVCACGAYYQLKDEFAGQTLSCPKCNAPVVASGGVAAAAAPATVDPAFDRDRFLLKQKHLAINEKYFVYDDAAKTLMFVERPAHMARNLLAVLGVIAFVIVALIGVFALASAVSKYSDTLEAVVGIGGTITALVLAVMIGYMLSPKRHVTFFRDESKQEKLLEVLQDKKWQPITVTYTVLDRMGQAIAHFQKNYLLGILRKNWKCLRPDGSLLCEAKEDSIILALLRRLLGSFYGLLRTNFIIVQNERVIGEFNRKFTLLDRYVLDLTKDRSRSLDRRVAVALGVMLDTGERR
jgi:uncharacterized protein YxjI